MSPSVCPRFASRALVILLLSGFLLYIVIDSNLGILTFFLNHIIIILESRSLLFHQIFNMDGKM